MVRSLFTISVLLLTVECHGQFENGFRDYYGEEPIKNDSTGVYYNFSKNAVIVFSNKLSTYRIYDKTNQLIENGSCAFTCLDCIGRDGKCTQYYGDGKIKASGYYYKNKPIGLWEKFYQDGKLQCLCNYAFVNQESLLSGPYEYYFENGSIKIKGTYEVIILDYNLQADSSLFKFDTTWIVDPLSGKESNMITRRKTASIKCGNWNYYNDKGEFLKSESYDSH